MVIYTLDTVDLFVAGIIHNGLMSNTEFQFAITYASRLAGDKCRQVGLNHLIQAFEAYNFYG
jgi:hypothetical protein